MIDILPILNKLWPSGDSKIPGLRAGIARTAQSVFQKYGITDNTLIAHVMAQISHECGAGTEVVENLNYSAIRMTQVWPSRFPTVASAQPYANNPRALADKVYNGRMGNAPNSDDGWNYRGRGATQTTGKEGYANLGNKMGLNLLSNPDLVNDPSRFLECGVADFILCGCLPYAQKDDILGVTKKLNGGTVGMDERRLWLSKWKAALATAPDKPAPKPPVIGNELPPKPPAPVVVPSPSPAPSKGFWASLIEAILSALKPKA